MRLLLKLASRSSMFCLAGPDLSLLCMNLILLRTPAISLWMLAVSTTSSVAVLKLAWDCLRAGGVRRPNHLRGSDWSGLREPPLSSFSPVLPPLCFSPSPSSSSSGELPGSRRLWWKYRTLLSCSVQTYN